ncbi:hypothetical protein I552_9308 [Mycobacterium xenopi 3993]|nr:hypothetical protein I552_9308 [Mycobacterium xenopi 3993]
MRIPESHVSPVRIIVRRVAIAVVVLLAAALVVYVGRGGYRDLKGGR